MYSLCAPKPYVETFDGSKDYPDPLMTEHNTFLQTESNKDIKIIELIRYLSNDIYTKSFEGITTMDIPESDLNMFINNIRRESFNTIYKKFPLSYSSTDIKSFEHTMYFIFLEYFNYILDPVSGVPLNNQLEAELVGSLSNEENERKYNDIKEKNTKIMKDILVVDSDLKIQFKNYTTFKKEKLYKRLLTTILENIYFTMTPNSNSRLACPLYNDNACPVSPYTTADPNKYPCQKETDLHNTIGLCVNSNNYVTTDCEIMNGYGKKMCELTHYNSSSDACSYDELTQKCLETPITWDTPALFTNCHEIYNNDLEKMKTNCNKYTKCNYKLAKDSDKDIGVCYAKKEDDRPDNFCLSLTGLTNDGISEQFSANSGDDSFGCSQINIDGVDYMNESTDTSHLKCEMFDNSNDVKDANGDNTSKPAESKTYSNSNANLKKMCNGLKDTNNLNKCEFVEYQKHIPSEYNSKYDKITMCIPKDVGKLPNDVINEDNLKRCALEGGFWDTSNMLCINTKGDCKEYKHKNTCDMLDNCLWASGGSGDTQDFEYGICKDISISLNRVDDLIDNIHETHIRSVIDLDIVEEQISKIVPRIQNMFTTL
jgi:hypothetical protein